MDEIFGHKSNQVLLGLEDKYKTEVQILDYIPKFAILFHK